MSESKKDVALQKTGDPVTDALFALTEGLTGLLAMDNKERLLTIGYVLQRLRGRTFLQSLKDEWQRLRDEGRIKEDYPRTEQAQACLQELLDCLDRDSPDKIKFDFVQRVFLAAAAESISDRQSVLPQELIRIARRLSGGEILVLSATYKLAQSRHTRQEHMGAVEWLDAVAKESGLEASELVEAHEDELMQKKLITRRTLGDQSGVTLGTHFRLTDLGLKLCVFVYEYDKIIQ